MAAISVLLYVVSIIFACPNEWMLNSGGSPNCKNKGPLEDGIYKYICWVQSMDLHNPWIALCKPWIRTLCGQSMDCALLVYMNNHVHRALLENA